MAPQSSFADDVGSQVMTFEPYALHFWLRAAASACGMGVALAGIPGRGLQRSAVARKAGSRWPPGVSSGCTRGGRGDAWSLPTSKTCVFCQVVLNKYRIEI